MAAFSSRPPEVSSRHFGTVRKDCSSRPGCGFNRGVKACTDISVRAESARAALRDGRLRQRDGIRRR